VTDFESALGLPPMCLCEQLLQIGFIVYISVHSTKLNTTLNFGRCQKNNSKPFGKLSRLILDYNKSYKASPNPMQLWRLPRRRAL